MAVKEFTAYKLNFTSPLHISDHRKDGSFSLRYIQSDTLYAAIIYILTISGEDTPEDGVLPFTVSSLFPYFKTSPKKETPSVFFLPMPLGTVFADVDDSTVFKKMKKVKWVDSKMYGEILSGKAPQYKYSDGTLMIQGDYLTKVTVPKDANGRPDFIVSALMQRASIPDRTGKEDTVTYYMDRIMFRPGSGLYFLADGKLDLLEKALDLLSLEGLGSDKNVGMGSFTYEKDTVKIEVPENADYMTSLSLFIPESKTFTNKMLEGENVAYDFSRRGGWITDTTLRKNVIYGFLPGSVFRIPEDIKNRKNYILIEGKTVDLQPTPQIGNINHPVWRSGNAMLFPIVRHSY